MKILLRLAVLLMLFPAAHNFARAKDAPRIINIINFVRAVEPRDSRITEDVLYDTVVEQAELMEQYGMTGTFLLQYDALVMPRYQSLMKELMSKGFEVGGWWEITQPHVEDAGMDWRGRYPWDWHADVGFATGYDPEEREKLVDVYMEKFHSIFGIYPSSVGSWFIDAHTLEYMYDKYGITASCNCKDQVGTDGYTFWGGYWNQAYYPSRLNAYMPAQTEEGQIPVPVFRMLGSDPVYQYDTGLGGTIQGVITLEPVYPDAGGSETWVRRFLDAICSAPCIGFNYTQAGQENSFTWDAMGEALRMQFPILDSLRRSGVRIETLAESGKWFKEQYNLTPPTSVTVLEDTFGNGNKTVWFDSRFYRANLLWNDEGIFFRDIHLFDEHVRSDYVDSRGTSNQCVYGTCPIMDGFRWSTPEDRASVQFLIKENGEAVAFIPDRSSVRAVRDREMQVDFVSDGSRFKVVMSESGMTISSNLPDTEWYLVMSAAGSKGLPLSVSTDGKFLGAEKNGIGYGIRLKSGLFETDGEKIMFVPGKGKIEIEC